MKTVMPKNKTPKFAIGDRVKMTPTAKGHHKGTRTIGAIRYVQGKFYYSLSFRFEMGDYPEESLMLAGDKQP